MKSARINKVFHDIANSDFSLALSNSERISTAENSNDKTQNANVLYGQAVSSLGVLLTRLSKDKKVKHKSSHIDQLLYSKQNVRINDREKFSSSLESKNNHEAKSESSASIVNENSDEIAEIENEIHLINYLFESAKNSMQPASINGIEYAINTLIPSLISLNQSKFSHRAKIFSAELTKFQLLYSTRFSVIEELNKVDEQHKSLFSWIYSTPNAVDKLKKTLNANTADALFLSNEQINQLYKQLLTWQHNKKYHEVFEHLENRVFLFDYLSKNDEFVEILKKYKGDITVDKVIMIRDIFSDNDLKNLCIIIKKLNENNLLSDAIFTNLSAIIHPSKNYYENIRQIANTISTSQLDNKNELLINLFNCTLDRIPHQKITDPQFNKFIAHVKTSCIKSGEINIDKIDTYLDLLALLSRGQGKILPLDKVCDLMKETEKLLGEESFTELCKKVLKYKMQQNDFITIMNLALQLRKESVSELFKLIDEHRNDIDALRHKMNDIIMKDYQLKYPERPLDEVIHDYLTKSNDVEYPIDANELDEIVKRYTHIKAIGEKLLTLGEIGIQSELENCKSILRRNPENESARMTLLAIIRLRIKNTFGINPYNVQMLNVLALLNQPKRIAQIKTGEGKSTLIAMLAAYYGIMNHKVDIITTSHDLAVRDADKYNSFYRSLGLTVGHNANKDQGDSNCYNRAIVYGTVSDFEFAYLRGETGSEPSRGNRPYDVVIADEVDSMFIDMQRNEAILSRPTDDTYKAEVYHDIWNWISKTEKADQNRENLQAMLKSKGVEISLELATTWLKSASTAKKYSEDKEYIIDYPEDKSKTKHRKLNSEDRVIKIVNKAHTGEVQSESTHWQGGLHEILEAKHKLHVHTESLTSASISHIEYFNKYKILAGLTGTLGSEACREELDKLYHISTYDSPPYKPSQKKPVPHQIARNEKSQITDIENAIMREVNAGRPVLILCESIKESKDLYERLSKKIKSIEIYNGVQHDSADVILSLAGNPGAVTIATNLAGRGTDIVVTPAAEANGGLHVVMTFPAINRRVEQQAFGRTGRQGRKGTYQYILREEQLSAFANEAKTVDEKISTMGVEREKHEKYVSQVNLFNYNLMHKLFIIQSVFFSLPENIKSHAMTEWAKFKTQAHKYTVQHMRDELEDSNEDNVIADILEDFNDFWEDTIASYGIRYCSPLDFVKSRLKQDFPDEYTKKLLIQGVMLFEDSRFDFSSELADFFIDMKSSELEESEPAMDVSQGTSNLMKFYQAKTNNAAPAEDKHERKGFGNTIKNLLKIN